MPAVVVAPLSANDVSAVVSYAGPRGIPVSVQGTAHTAGGQSVHPDGITVATKSLADVEVMDSRGKRAIVQAGVTWMRLVRQACRENLIPPVLTTNLFTTVGGTLAFGGLGPFSFRYGTQADNCTAIELVTGDGQICSCSEVQNKKLFDLARCGMGQFGVITKASVKLLPATNSFLALTVFHGDLAAWQDTLFRLHEHAAIAAVATDVSWPLDKPGQPLLTTSIEVRSRSV